VLDGTVLAGTELGGPLVVAGAVLAGTELGGTVLGGPPRPEPRVVLGAAELDGALPLVLVAVAQ
jgi:hypothetical protein